MELHGTRRHHGGERARVLLDGAVQILALDERVGAREDRLGAGPVVGGNAVSEERLVDAQARGEPLDRLLGRARLAPLDLGDVLLREAIAGEIRLRQTRGNAKLAQALAQTSTARSGWCDACGAGGHGRRSVQDT